MDRILNLLKAKDDTTRFAGLLLVTKTLRPEDDEARWMVLEAVGPEFLLRLLLPLKQARVHPRPLCEDEIEHQIALACLGLSVVSNLLLNARVARCEALKQPVSRIAVSVLKEGSIRPLIAHYVKRENVDVSHEIDYRALKDASDCLTALVQENLDILDETCPVFTVLSKELSKQYESIGTGKAENEYVQSLFKCTHVCLVHKVKGDTLGDEVGRTLLPTLAKYVALVHLVRDGNGKSELYSSKEYMEYQLAALHCLAVAFGRFQTGWTQQNSEHQVWSRPMLTGLEALIASPIPMTEKFESYAILVGVIEEIGVAWFARELECFELVSLMLRIEIELLVIDAISPESRVAMQNNVELFGSRSDRDDIETTAREQDLKSSEEEGQSSSTLVEETKGLQLKEKRQDYSVAEERSSGERAAQYLPVCLSVFEQLVNALCYVTERNMHEGKIVKIFNTVAESADLLLQYVEDASSIGDMSATQQVLFTMCLGALGRFLSQNPLQFSDRVIALLPKALKNGPDSTHTLGTLMPFILAGVIPEYVNAECEDARLKLQLSKQMLDPRILPSLMTLLSEQIDLAQESLHISSEDIGEHPVTMLLYLSTEALATVDAKCLKTANVSPIYDVIASEKFRKMMSNDVVASNVDFFAASIGLLARLHLVNIATTCDAASELLNSWIRQCMPTIVQHIFDFNNMPIHGDDEDTICSLSAIEDSMFTALSKLCSKDSPNSPRDIPIEPWSMPLSELVHMFS